MASQWQNFLRNLGEWRGSFATLQATGALVSISPSILTMESEEEGRLVRFGLRRWPAASKFRDDCRGYAQLTHTCAWQVVRAGPPRPTTQRSTAHMIDEARANLGGAGAPLLTASSHEYLSMVSLFSELVDGT